MTFPDQDQPEPPEISFNGELATPEELAGLESLAASFLESETATVHHTYGYMADNGRAGVIFTLEQTDTADNAFTATISANTGDMDDPFFVFSVDQSNAILVNFLHIDQGYRGLLDVLQKVKEEETLDAVESALLDHLESFTLNAEFGPRVGAEVAAQFWPATATQEKTALAQFLRTMVLDHTAIGLRVHEANPLADDRVMVLQHDFVGITSQEDIEDLPRFQVVVIDPVTGAQYCYTTDFYGTKALYVDETGGVGEADVEDDIEAFADALGLYEPSRADVIRMLELLNDAWLQLNGVSGG